MGAIVEDTFIGLDVGSSKIAAVMGVRDAEGRARFVDGIQGESRGVRNGIVVDIPEAAACIESVLADLEEATGRRVGHVCLSVGGPQVEGVNGRGKVAILPPGREIIYEDVQAALAAARDSVTLGDTRALLHEIPRAYTVDGQPGVRDPQGMHGYELNVEVHYATGLSTAVANLVKCVREARLEPEALVAAPLAAGEVARAAYDSTEPFAIADIGAETTDLAIYTGGSIWLSQTTPIGGADISREIASRFKLSLRAAEEVKRRFGAADLSAVDEIELVDLPPSAGMDAMVPRAELARVIQERAYSLADALCQPLEDARAAGVEPERLILTGGAAALPGLAAMMTTALEVPVECGVAVRLADLPGWLDRPDYTVAAGAALWYLHCAPYPSTGGSSRAGHSMPSFMRRARNLLRAALP
jgi:cell division protein FtsA